MLIDDSVGYETSPHEAVKQISLQSAAVEPVIEFGHVRLEVLRFDFVVRAQEKALPVGQGKVHPRKESMSGLRISVPGVAVC